MFRQRFYSAFIIILILFINQISFAGSNGFLPLSQEEKQWLEDHPVIYYAPDPIFAPVEFINAEGDPNGIAIEYLDWIEKNYDIHFEIVQLKNWTDILEGVRSKEIDLMSATKTPQRSEYAIFTDSYVNLENTILVRDDSYETLSEDALQDIKTGVMRGYAVSDYLEIKYQSIELIKFDSIEEALKKLSFGTIDALVLDIGQASYYTSEFGITNLRSAGDVDFTYEMTFAMRDDYVLLRSILNKAIQSMPNTEVNRIKTSWISYKLENQFNKEIVVFSLIVLIVTLLALSAFLLWNRLLRKQVYLQTQKLEKELELRKSIQDELLAKNQQITNMNNELEMAQRELSNLIDLVPYHIFAKEKNGEYVLVNDSFIQFYGLSKNAVLGRMDHEIFSNKPVSFMTEFSHGDTDVYEQHKSIVVDEMEILDSSGKDHIMRLKKIPYFIWKTKEWGMLGVTIDITDLKHAEQKLEDLNEKLEAKVERRTYLLNETNRELELSMYKLQMKQSQLEETNLLLEDSLVNLRDTQNQLIESEKLAALGRLVAGVSHEINTPLGIGITSISFLEMESDDMIKIFEANKLTRTKLSEFLEGLQNTTKLVLANLKNAASLVNKFKQIAVDQSTEELREFNLHEYLDGIIQSLSPQLKHTNYKVQLTCPEDINIRSYPSILTQIITNLVMNSLVHGFDGVNQGKMLLSVDPIEDKMLTLHYWDDGIGIQPDHVEKIFEPFFTTKRGQGGVGLGLNIVYNLITRTLSGTIDVESQPGEGVHFIIKVPVPDKMDQTVFSNEDQVYS